MLVTGPQVEVMRREVLGFLRQRDPYFLGTGGHSVVVELYHPFSSASPLRLFDLRAIIR